MKPAITLIGTGRMGVALARSLAKAGYKTTAWNRSPEKALPLADDGVHIAGTLEQAVAASSVIVINVTDYAATKALMRRSGLAELLAGKLILDLTSGTPEGAREAGRWAAAQGARYLDGAILASPDFVGTEAGTILVSGPKDFFDANHAWLAAFGGNIQHIGDDIGLANALDSAVLGMMWGALFGALTSIAVCEAENIGIDELARQWRATAPVVDGLVTNLIERTAAGRFEADAETLATVSPHASTFRYLRDLIGAHGIDPAIAEGQAAIFDRAIAAGHIDDDFAVMSRFMRNVR
jgi:3-hydroxyisobutyrate dehydrogenase-like beta-hydroxyacid dehydrogenase